MGINDYHDKVQNPAKVFRRWRGGEGKLTNWDGEKDVEMKLPFKFAILEQTRRISGFAPSGTGVRFYSNEAVGYNDEIRVMRKEGDKPAEEVISGKYSDIKEKLPQGARLAVQLYIYNPEEDRIEVLTCQGASLGAFIEYSKKNKIYENYTVITKGEQAKNGAVTFYPPEFASGADYNNDELEKYREAGKEVQEYLKTLTSKKVGYDDIDQTPVNYDGEQSQEIVEEKVEDKKEEPINLTDIPF